MIARNRLRQMGWIAILAVCFTAFLALTFHVNAVKSEVRLAERKIVALQRKKILLETEFQTRANQQQLADWNAVEFGYQAPKADQYLESERQLAKLGQPRGDNAPDPIRVARAPDPAKGDNGYPAMVSPLTGEPVHMPAARKQSGDSISDLAETLSLQAASGIAKAAEIAE